MKYENIIEGIFIERPNRFIALVEIDGNIERVHVKNTGRCKELLIPGTTVFLEDFKNRMGTRKLRYSLIGVIKKENNLIINMDSQAPNKVVEEALISGSVKLPNMDALTLIKREKTYKDSRFDFYIEDASGKKGFIEVKGVTLEKDGIVRFPDAPTTRGVKHIHELMYAKKEGYEAFVIFVIQMKGMKEFQPNYDTHPEFGEALVEAESVGVNILAYECRVTSNTLDMDTPVNINLI